MRRSLALIAVVAALAPTAALADARSKARRHFQEGLAALEREEFTKAIEEFEKANATIPHTDVQYNLARACADAGRFEEAVKWFEVYLSQPVAPLDRKEVEGAIRTLRARIEAPLKLPAPPPEPPPGEAPVTATAPPTEDAKRLEKTAADLRAIAPERAAELEAIARRMSLVPMGPPAPAAPATPPPPAPPPPAEEPVVLALPKDEPREVEDYEEREVVVAATGQAARPEDAPAVVWVITQREIRERGYESVAEALETVAGLHVIDDLVFVDVGIRGVHGGFRGQSRLFKVLINGQPVAFRPTSGNFLGPEMIPIRAVERVELIRGPASALYGENAFLGVLQIITRKGGDIRGGSIAGRWGINTSAKGTSGRSITPQSGSADLIVGTESGKFSVLLTGSFASHDRSGLALPSTSPLATPLAASGGDVSVEDRASPLSLFGTLSYNLDRHGRISLETGLMRLSSDAEWLDVGALTHFNQVVLQNFWARASYERPFGPDLGLELFASYSHGAPGAGHRFRPLRPGAAAPDATTHIVERFESNAVNAGAELRWDLAANLGLRIGADLDVDFEELVSADIVYDRDFGVYQAGNRAPIPEAQQGAQELIDVGAYVQLTAAPLEWVNLIGGLRADFHNLYEQSLSGRVGSVFRLPAGLYLKALYGSSFRAPSPDQLFHGSAYVGDTVGCRNFAPCNNVGLQPQTAHTGELVFGYALESKLGAQLTGYLSFVDDLIISFPTQGEAFVTTNAGSRLSKGLELELSAGSFALGALRLKGHAFFSFTNTESDIPESLFNPPESIRQEFRQASLFPDLSGGGGVDLFIPAARLGLYLEGKVVGPRRASASNLALGAAGYEDENLPAFVELDANLSTRELFILEDRETVISLRLTDLVGAAHAEGGFRGWDVPTLGRTLFLRLIQEL